MPEFLFLLSAIFIIPTVFVFFHVPLIYLQWCMILLCIIMFLPLIYTLFSAPFVPSKKNRVETMIKLAQLTEKDSVCELGCGDARVIREAAKKGVKKAIGYDISIPLVLYGKIRQFFTKNSAKIQWRNIWIQDYSHTDVIFCYLLSFAMKRLKNEIWPKLKPGTRLISNTFELPGVQEEKKENGVYLYIKK